MSQISELTQAPDCAFAQWDPSPNFGYRYNERVPEFLILHYTGMSCCQAARAQLKKLEARVSAHYLVDLDGSVVQMVAEADRAWHAGLGSWEGDTDINSCSIGIEIHNTGHDDGYPAFPDVQMRAVEKLCLDILSRYEIVPQRVLGHSDVAPARKRDPGEKFDWERLAKAGIGLWIEPPAPDGDEGLKPGDEGVQVDLLQADLARFGYGITVNGVYDTATEQVVTAFQRHYRPARVDGCADVSTRTALAQLLERVYATT